MALFHGDMFVPVRSNVKSSPQAMSDMDESVLILRGEVRHFSSIAAGARTSWPQLSLPQTKSSVVFILNLNVLPLPER